MDEKANLMQSFSSRLITLLINKGHISRSAATGVKVKELAGIANCSFEMARRYTNGNALPDPLAIKNIANWLNVDPGWLLYGPLQEEQSRTEEPFFLSKSELKLVLGRIIPAYLTLQNSKGIEISQLNDFFCDIIADFARMHAPQNVKEMVLDTSISSALHFVSHSQVV